LKVQKYVGIEFALEISIDDSYYQFMDTMPPSSRHTVGHAHPVQIKIPGI
jgi:hypothetical protein